MSSSECRTRDNGRSEHLGVFTYGAYPGKVEIHTYGEGQMSGKTHIFTLPIEEFLNAVRSIPGVEVTYTPPVPPKPKYFPKIGTVIRHRSGSTYYRLNEDKWVTSGRGYENYFTDKEMFYQDDPLKCFTEL